MAEVPKLQTQQCEFPDLTVDWFDMTSFLHTGMYDNVCIRMYIYIYI